MLRAKREIYNSNLSEEVILNESEFFRLMTDSTAALAQARTCRMTRASQVALPRP